MAVADSGSLATYAGNADHLPSTSASVAVDVRGAVTPATVTPATVTPATVAPATVAPARTRTYVGGTAVRKQRTVRLTVVVTGARACPPAPFRSATATDSSGPRHSPLDAWSRS